MEFTKELITSQFFWAAVTVLFGIISFECITKSFRKIRNLAKVIYLIIAVFFALMAMEAIIKIVTLKYYDVNIQNITVDIMRWLECVLVIIAIIVGTAILSSKEQKRLN